MKGRLFLTSYFAETAPLFEKFVNPWIRDRKVLFIPTAGNTEEYRGYIEEGMQCFQAMGYEVHVMDAAETDEAEAVWRISGTGFLYVSGGNTFYLMQELRRKHLTELIRSRTEEGMVYAGESAGAVIAAPDIGYNQIMDDSRAAPELMSYRGLGLVPFSVLPHYGEFPFAETSAQTFEKYHSVLNLVPLTNAEAVIADGPAWCVRGLEDVVLSDEKKEGS